MNVYLPGMGRRERFTRDQVLAAAREIFSVRGFEGTTLAAIAGRLGLSPAALLRHAPTKQALFEAAMTSPAGELRVPLEFLAEVDAARQDPRQVLREIGKRFVPFIEEKLGEAIALWLRSNALAVAGDAPTPASALPEIASLPLPFDRDRHPTPPERALALVEGYFRRAKQARRLALSDPRAAAVAYLATLHSYVVLHRVVRAVDPPVPLERYLDTVVEIWTRGAVRPVATHAGPAPPSRRTS
jgi:AcrR family transcriptional regulator